MNGCSKDEDIDSKTLVLNLQTRFVPYPATPSTLPMGQVIGLQDRTHSKGNYIGKDGMERAKSPGLPKPVRKMKG